MNWLLKLLDKAEKSQDYKASSPIVKSIYQTNLVAIPYYRSIAREIKGWEWCPEQWISLLKMPSQKLKPDVRVKELGIIP